MLENTIQVQKEFRSVVEEGAQLCVAHFTNRLKAAYIHGSIAFSEALPGVSDADCLMLFDEEPKDEDRVWAKNQEIELQRKFPVVSVFHLHLFSLDRVREEPWWRFMLRHNAIRLYGADIPSQMESEGIEIPPPARPLAKRFVGFMRKNIEQALTGHPPKELFKLPDTPTLASRKFARVLIVITGGFLLMVDNAFGGFRQGEVIERLKIQYPQWKSVFLEAEKILQRPREAVMGPDEFIAKADPFCRWALDRIEEA
jgi:hypothetical protein